METGESEESVSSEYTGPDLEIGFNAQYLLDFLRATAGASRVRAEGSEERRANCVRPAIGTEDQYRYVVMPMRI